MMKVTIVFENDGKKFRTISAEGSEMDVMLAVISLAAQFEARIEADNDALGGEDPEMVAMGERLEAEMLRRFGPDAMERLNTRLENSLGRASDIFMEKIGADQAKIGDLTSFVTQFIRTETLSELPEFPEDLLDEALKLMKIRLDAYALDLASKLKGLR
jgi:hypothetical protein